MQADPELPDQRQLVAEPVLVERLQIYHVVQLSDRFACRRHLKLTPARHASAIGDMQRSQSSSSVKRRRSQA